MKVIQPRPFHPGKALFVFSVLLAVTIYHFFFRDTPGPDHVHWTGSTMGTHYVIRIAQSPLTQNSLRELHSEIEAYLLKANKQMSTYLRDSEITKFNQSRTTDPFEVSPAFAEVTRYAVKLSEMTDGAFDPTIDPLLALWGFGPDANIRRQLPDTMEIERAMGQTGYEHIAVPADNLIQKRIPEITLNLNAIAKGYAADRVSEILNSHGLTNHYVELGGDLIVSGKNHDGKKWRIGIEIPDPDSEPGTSLAGIANISNAAVAGSGDYRDVWTGPDGETYSHILDPRTGAPVRHNLGAVTVIAPTCMKADGIATAVFVMGPEEGVRWINERENTEAMFIYRNDENSYGYIFSDGFKEEASFDQLID